MKKLENEYRKTTSNTLLKGFDKAKSGKATFVSFTNNQVNFPVANASASIMTGKDYFLNGSVALMG
jgi:hypothetical protein